MNAYSMEPPKAFEAVPRAGERTKLSVEFYSHLRVDGSAQCDLGRLAGGTMPFMRRYSIICP